MLPPSNPKRRVSQAPLKETKCIAGCGSTVLYRTNAKVLCRPCAVKRKAESARLAAHRQRRKRGIPRVLGTTKNCAGCGNELRLNRNADAKLCKACGHAAYLERARLASRQKAATPAGRAATNEWQRKKRERDPSWRVTAHMRVLMHRALQGKKAGRSWREFVPYSLEELMAHLERQFLPGMTWENKGKWHIDHIRPLSSFSFVKPEDAEFQEAWSLANLRPLWGIDNIRKQARRTHLL